MTPEAAWTTAKSELPARISALRKRSYSELIALPPYENEDATYGEHHLRWTVYRDVLEDRSLKIVVQFGFKTGKLFRKFDVGHVIAEWIPRRSGRNNEFVA